PRRNCSLTAAAQRAQCTNGVSPDGEVVQAGGSFGAGLPPLERSLAMRVRSFALLMAGLAALLPASAAFAEVVYFKDGFTVEGSAKGGATTIYDPVSRTGIPIALPGGFCSVEDGARIIIFSPYQVQEVGQSQSRKGQVAFTQEPPAKPIEELNK